MVCQLLYILKSAVFALKNRNRSVPPIVYKQLLEKTLSWFTEVGRTHGLERRPRDLKQAPREVYNSRKISCGPGSRAAPMNSSADKIIVTGDICESVDVDRWKCGGQGQMTWWEFWSAVNQLLLILTRIEISFVCGTVLLWVNITMKRELLGFPPWRHPCLTRAHFLRLR